MKNNPIEKIRDLLAEPEARRKAAICAGLAAALAVGGAGIAIASNRPEPIDSTPSAVEKAGAESVAPADIAKICPTLTLDGQDVGAPADEVTVTTGKGRVFVTQRAGDDAAATVDSTARRSAALARSERTRCSHALSSAMKSRASQPAQSRAWKNSLLSRPKKPSIRALSQLLPLRDMLLTSPWRRQTSTQPGQR